MAVEYKCNMCGKTMDTYDRNLDMSFGRSIGYGSKYDGEIFDIDLCCDCFDKLVDFCKIPPLRKCVNVDTEEVSE